MLYLGQMGWSLKHYSIEDLWLNLSRTKNFLIIGKMLAAREI